MLVAAPVFLQQFVPPGRNEVAWAASPHFDARPDGAVVDTIVLHHTAGTSLAGTVAWFSSPESEVSAHFTVGRDGSIVQHVSTYQRAWHAGASRDALGRTGVNAFSVGIEIDHPGTAGTPYTPEQVEAVAHLVAAMTVRFPIRQITSHMGIATPAGRKIDPIEYPWHTLHRFGVEIVP
jgi:N-acetylmuramoyl-L-alanine amidase/AmpD protein